MIEPGYSSESLYKVAEQLAQEDPSSRVVGSLGRNAIMGLPTEAVRPNGVPRNINVFHTEEGNADKYGSPELTFHGTDLSTRFDQWIRTEANDTWLVFPANEGVHVPLVEPEEVLQPHDVDTGSGVVRTVSPEVLDKITRLMYVTRPKDADNFERYKAFVETLSPSIHPGLLQPFDEFAQHMSKQRLYHLKAQVRNVYHRTIPEEYRRNLRVAKHLPGVGLTPFVDKR